VVNIAICGCQYHISYASSGIYETHFLLASGSSVALVVWLSSNSIFYHVQSFYHMPWLEAILLSCVKTASWTERMNWCNILFFFMEFVCIWKRPNHPTSCVIQKSGGSMTSSRKQDNWETTTNCHIQLHESNDCTHSWSLMWLMLTLSLLTYVSKINAFFVLSKVSC